MRGRDLREDTWTLGGRGPAAGTWEERPPRGESADLDRVIKTLLPTINKHLQVKPPGCDKQCLCGRRLCR